MPDSGGRPIAPPPTYYYRRSLSVREMLPALGVGLGAGIAAFYLARLLLQREPLARAPSTSRTPSLTRRGTPSRRDG